MPFQWSDAWLLHAVCAAGGGRATTLASVVAAGDYINHAVLTAAEIRGGVARLVAAGHVVVEKAKLRPRGAALKLWRDLTKKRRRIDTLQTAFEKLLAVEATPRPALTGVVPPASWPSEVAVEDACREYLAMAEAASSRRKGR
jgi:hypothetical protein